MSHMYFDTFITVAPDYAGTESKVPAPRGSSKTIAELQFEMLHPAPYRYTQEDVLFQVWLVRTSDLDEGNLADDEIAALRDEYFSTGRACLRASPLTKSHGWGVAFDGEGRAALVPLGSSDYERYANDEALTVVPAMRSKRASSTATG